MEAKRGRPLEDLRALAKDAEAKKIRRRENFRKYSLIRNVLWSLAAVLAGLAGVLAVVDGPNALTATSAFGSAFVTGLETRINPADRRRKHLQAAADYDDIAWRAKQATSNENGTSELVKELKTLHGEMHSLDREFGPAW